MGLRTLGTASAVTGITVATGHLLVGHLRRQISATINGTLTDYIYADTPDVADSLTLDDQNATEFAGDYVRSEFSITPGKITTIQYA